SFYTLQYEVGSAMKLSIEETFTGSYFVHRPPSPRNVGIPLSAETPAPVSAIPACALDSSSAARPIRPLITCSYLREGSAERPRIAADARDLHRGRCILRGALGAWSHGSAVRAWVGSGSFSGRGALRGGHAGGGRSLDAVGAADRPLRRPIAAHLLDRRRRRFSARRRRHHDSAAAVHLAGGRRARRRRSAGGAVFGRDRVREERAAGPRDGMAHLLDAGRILHRAFNRRAAAELARHPHR